MDEFNDALDQAFRQYRQDLEEFERKRRPMDGLLGFGRSLKDDHCHDRLDERVGKAIAEMNDPSPEEAERVVRLLLLRDDTQTWPLEAQWMLRAIERHSLPLIPHLTPLVASDILKNYNARYRRWDRLPIQTEIFSALKARTK